MEEENLEKMLKEVEKEFKRAESFEIGTGQYIHGAIYHTLKAIYYQNKVTIELLKDKI